MRIINNSSNVTVSVQGIPSSFNSNIVQTVVNDPVVPPTPPTICFFFDFDCGCFFNPCDNFNDCFDRRCNPCFRNCNRRCRNCGCQQKKFCKRRC